MQKRILPPLAVLMLTLGALLLTACGLPALDHRQPSSFIADTGSTRLGRLVLPMTQAHPGTSGIYPLNDARDAFAARVILAHSAERSLDIQYYIWRDDLTGTLLFEALHQAADRGVRVRLLLDDNNTNGLDETLAMLDAHANIEVRLFNPFAVRSLRMLGFITDFSRVNRRMHNKSFTADNQATIVGGRNIGDEYFGATDGMLFSDLDVLAFGPIVTDVSQDFDRYWNSDSSYPVAGLLPPIPESRLNQLQAEASVIERSPEAAQYVRAISQADLIHRLEQGSLDLEWVTTRLVSDDPAKGLGHEAPGTLLPAQLNSLLGTPRNDVRLVSPYFVPTAAGVEAFSELVERGVHVSVLTNSLESTDVAVVHAGYAKRRKELLAAGVRLFELRRIPQQSGTRANITGGSSSSSLHAKTFAVDRRLVFVGSFNFDPRSANLNTEMGVLIDSPILAHRIETAFNRDILANSYEVKLSDTGSLYWLERRDGKEIRHDTEPGAGLLLRAWVGFAAMLPIEWLL